MLRKMCTGKLNDECYSVMLSRPNSGFYITGVKDNERDKFYRITTGSDGIFELIRDLNIKESIRSEHYQNIIHAFEINIRQAEDRYIEMFYKNEELEERIKELENEIKSLKEEGVE